MKKQLQSFFNFVNFYRRFIPAFATLVLPLINLLRTKSQGEGPRKPGQRLNWSLECQQAFERLKALFATEPILRHPDTKKPFVVQVDASDMTVGGVLL